MRTECSAAFRSGHLYQSAAAVLLSASLLQAATLVHQYDLSANLNDSLPTGVSLQVHPNTATSGFGADGWWWTATATPGGGLILATDRITNPLDYSLGFRIQFDQVGSGGGGGGSSYRKLVSFKAATDDNGLYFQNANIVFYPFGVNASITYTANTFYDFIFSRSAADAKIRVFVVQGDGTVTKVYEENDPGQDAVPLNVGGGIYQFMLFMDDTATSGEWSGGGTCQSVRVWNGPLVEAEVGDALSNVATGAATSVTNSSATLTGTVNPAGSQTTVTFQIGLTTGYGSELTADESPVDGASNVAVSKSVTGLAAGSTYHYRVKAVNGGGTTYGSDRTFTTETAVAVETSAGTAAWLLGGSAAVVDPGLTLDAANITGFKVSISGNLSAGDVLSFTGALPGGVSSSYAGGTGILTFTGTAGAAAWQTLLRTLTFSSTSASTATRTISFTMGGAIPYSGNSHFYEYVPSANIIWSDARTAAAGRQLFGLQGYLATITSQEENDFLRQKLGADAWIGGSDEAVEGVWRWVTGPETGTQFSTGSASFNGHFANWNGGEPNNCCAGEHYAEIFSTDGVGKWNDLSGLSVLAGYVVEYGGMAGDPSPQLTAGRNVLVVTADPPTVTTTPVSGMTASSAESGGTVTSDGGAAVSARGVCWNTTGSPTTGDSLTTNGTGTGAYASILTGLSAGTTYYVRAYATNIAGTSYGAQETFAASALGGGALLDQCPEDPNKAQPGLCGCGVAETDTDGDGTPDCTDGCPADPAKTAPGTAGCGASDLDTDGDGVRDSADGCPNDPNKTRPGLAGCGIAETDSDNDGVPDSLDGCPGDPNKSGPGSRGCGVPESPDLQIAITLNVQQQPQGGTSVNVGDQIHAVVLVSNAGNGAASNVWVTIPLPPGTAFVSVTLGLVQSGQTVPTGIIIESDRVSFPVGDVPAGYQVSATLVLRALASGNISLTPQTISDQTPQPVTGSPASAEVGDIYDRVITTSNYPALCGSTGAVPLLLTAFALGLMRRQR